MGKLNQVIAVVAPKKKKVAETITAAYHTVQKAPLFDGIIRTYEPRDAEGERLPAESKSIQAKVGTLIKEFASALTEMFDVVATQDYANCTARADISVDGQKILSQVPVTHLLFLEKQLNDVETFVTKLPILDPAEEWSYNEAADQYATKPSETTRTKKVPVKFVKYDATKEHPAQVEVVHEDKLAGYWKTIKFSGAIPAKERNEMLGRVRKLHEAVVKAREEANGAEAPPVKTGNSVLSFVFGTKY